MRSYLPSANESGPPSISSPPPRWLTKFRSRASWSWVKNAGLEVVEDDRVVAVQLVGGLGEAVPQLDLVERAEADQDRLVVPLGGLGVGVVEPVEQGAGPAARALRKSNFGWRRAIRTRPTSWTCSSSASARRRNLNSQLGRPLT